MNFLDQLKYDERGLVAVVVQDAETGEVLMLAYANRRALEETLRTGFVHFYSRSRGKLWLKGETSGHRQHLRELRVDCDGDAVLVKVVQEGGACHTGYRSCFYRRLAENTAGAALVEDGEKVFEPGDVYGKG